MKIEQSGQNILLYAFRWQVAKAVIPGVTLLSDIKCKQIPSDTRCQEEP
jgi:hypothetical protein